MKNIEQLVKETMDSLDGVQRVSANPYLYTRIEQRLKNRFEPAYPKKLLPVLALSLVLFISLNVLSYFQVNENGTDIKSSTGIERFAKEYNLSYQWGI